MSNPKDLCNANGPTVPRQTKDPEMIGRSLEALGQHEGVVELRIPRAYHRGTLSGYFDDSCALAKSATAMSGKAPGIYVTLNPVNPDLLARAPNRLVAAQHTTTDADVVRRCWFLIDVDPKRPAEISSTDDEHEAAFERARQCREWLGAQGWPDPIFADSGNGSHLVYRVDLPNDKCSTELLKSCLAALRFLFNCYRVQIDPDTFNASLVLKAWGTLAAKGDSIPARPHRLARLLDVPSVPKTVAVELMTSLAEHIQRTDLQVQAKSLRHKGASGFDVEEYIADHKLDVIGPANWKDASITMLSLSCLSPSGGIAWAHEAHGLEHQALERKRGAVA